MSVRKGNLLLSVEQNNQSKTLIITNYNSEDAKYNFLGYDLSDIQGDDFTKILPENVNEIIEDNLEYSFEGHDLKEVLEKIIRFSIKSRGGEEVFCNIKIERGISDMDKFSFDIALEKKVHISQKIAEITAAVEQSFALAGKASRDSVTGLITKAVADEVFDKLFDYCYEQSVSTVLSKLTIDSFDFLERERGHEYAEDLLRTYSEIISKTFRANDFSVYIGGGKFLTLLSKTTASQAIYAFKRLEENLKKREGILSDTSMNIRFIDVDVENEVQNLLAQLDNSSVKHDVRIN